VLNNNPAVVNGNFEADQVEIQDMASDESVKIYVNRSFDVKSADLNVIDGNAGQLSTYVRSQQDSKKKNDVQLRGGSSYFGLIYAPESDCVLRGGGGGNPNNLDGAMICETITAKGGSSFDLEYDPAVKNAKIPDGTTLSFITFLHVSEHKVTVDSR